MGELRRAFALFDENGDGSVTAEELYAVMRTLGESSRKVVWKCALVATRALVPLCHVVSLVKRTVASVVVAELVFYASCPTRTVLRVAG